MGQLLTVFRKLTNVISAKNIAQNCAKSTAACREAVRATATEAWRGLKQREVSAGQTPLFIAWVGRCVSLRPVAATAPALSLGGNHALLADAGSFTGKVAQIVQLGTTYLTYLVNLDRINVRRLDGEDTLHTYGSRHLSYGEALLVAMA